MRTIKDIFKKHHLLSVFIGILPLLLLRAGVAQATPLAHAKTWKVVASPNTGASDQLNGIAAISTKDVWAVGDYINSSNIQQTLIEQWTGSSWSIVDSGVYNNSLFAVVAVSARDVWAVGSSDNPSTLIEHWNGTNWSAVPSPAPGAYSGLSGVARVPGTKQLWAVGYYATSNVSQTLTEFYG